MHDVIIVGAGPGGSAAAYYLARQGLDVLLLDKATFPRDKTCGDGLTPRALGILENMGLLDNLCQVGYRVNRLEIVSPKGCAVEAPFPGQNGQSGHTLIVPRLTLDDAIRAYALNHGAKFESPVRVMDVTADQHGVTVTGKRQSQTFTARARLAIIATGASVPLLLHMGLLKKTPLMALAARAYFENVRGLSDAIQLRFDGVPMPGYGWVFPLPDSAANVGAGIFPAGWDRWRMRAAGTARAAFDAFIQAPAVQAMLTEARQVGPIKGYPLRMDFATAPTYGERVLLVGEAAGLVNPLTGEGIDYALETGKIAAEHIITLLTSGDLSCPALAEYDQLLRQRFQRLFIICTWIRDLFVNPLLINHMVSGAARRPDLKMTLINIAFGKETTLENITLGRILKKVLKVRL
jgi:geranylgeranyl reductase family protein